MWESLFTLQGSYYPLLVHMFYGNMHTISLNCSFWVTICGQFFQITSLSIRHVQTQCLFSFFLLEVQSLTLAELISILVSLYGAPHELLAYISLADLSKPTQIIATFLTYPSYLSSHHTKIHRSTTRFIHVILFGQQFDIGKVIINTIILY